MARVTMRQVLVGAMWAICILVLYSVYPRQTYSGYAQLEANASGMKWSIRTVNRDEFVLRVDFENTFFSMKLILRKNEA